MTGYVFHMMWTEEALDSLVEAVQGRMVSGWPAIRRADHSAYLVSTLAYSPSIILQTAVDDTIFNSLLFRTYVGFLDDKIVISQLSGSARLDNFDLDYVVQQHFMYSLFRMAELNNITPTECVAAISHFQPDSGAVDATL